MDVKCVVCGEPWDYYGITHGDMLKWEAQLFRSGAGCPACEGVKREVTFEPKSLSDLEYGDLDPALRLEALERFESSKAPKWERPTPPVLWTCEGCGVNVVRNPDDSTLEYDLPYAAKGRKWYHSHNYDSGQPTELPAHVFEPNRPVCEFCLKSCDDCDRPICGTLEYGDTYDDGNSFPNPSNYYGHGLCIECLSNRCSECESKMEDCSCDSAVEEEDEGDESTCIDCGEEGKTVGHQDCQYPGRVSDRK